MSKRRSERLQQYLSGIADKEAMLEQIAGLESSFLESFGGLEGVSPGVANGVLEKVANGGSFATTEADFLEAIVLPRWRPVVDIIDDSYGVPPAPWTKLGKQEVKAKLKKIIPNIGRVEVPNLFNVPYAGTAFLVGDDLMMTNRHVAHVFAEGLGRRNLRFIPGQTALVDFVQEAGGRDAITVTVEKVLMVHPFWDMALLKVSALPAGRQKLTLSTAHPEDLLSREVVVVGYPARDYRNDGNLQDQLFQGRYNIKRLAPGKLNGRALVKSGLNLVEALKHDGTTLGGNSGSAVIDLTSFEIVGLHFAGRYLESNYAVPTYELARDGVIVDAGVAFSGTVASNGSPYQALWDRYDVERPATPPADTEDDLQSGVVAVERDEPTSRVSGGVSLTIPLHIRVSLGEPTTAGRGEAFAEDTASSEKLTISPDPDYENREGYRPAFLGEGDLEVPLPWLESASFAQAAYNGWDSDPKTRHIFTYHNYSVILCKPRKLAFVAAVNIDGARTMEMSRKRFNGDKWFYDPRLPRSLQAGEELYEGNPLDRGHLVRRLDPVWGTSFAQGKAANDDTFHFTNCSPQHLTFNRDTAKKLWGGIEIHILDHAKDGRRKMSVFNGPVFRPNDRLHRGVKIPSAYWKVVVVLEPDETLAASAFMLSQHALIADLPSEGIATEKWKMFHLPIAELEEKIHMHFHQLGDFDTYGVSDEGVESAIGVATEITSLDQLIV